jgi:hypothetical protein
MVEIVLGVRAGTPPLAGVNTIALAGVADDLNDRLLGVVNGHTVECDDRERLLKSAARSWFDTFVSVGGVLRHGFSFLKPRLGCSNTRAFKTPRGAGLSLLLPYRGLIINVAF